LGKTTDHAAGYTAEERRGTGVAGVELGFRGNEEEDGALG
jgi:hypothetical protein